MLRSARNDPKHNYCDTAPAMPAKRHIIPGWACLSVLLLAFSLVGCFPAANLSGLHITPDTISPNGDGIDDEAIISYTLGRDSSMSITLVNKAGVEYS
ncbi:MAG: hypothetical protein Q8P59_07835, partial [Dehalococcoidia bacterium]|nr:hypothetical protein [Dehalococcoidia bacterium]